MSLLKYILKKMLMLLPVLVGISIIAFALGIMSPGDPVDQVLNPNGNESYTQEEYDAMAAKMGLDQPAVVQYFNWVDGLAHGDLVQLKLTVDITQLYRTCVKIATYQYAPQGFCQFWRFSPPSHSIVPLLPAFGRFRERHGQLPG